MGDVDSQLLEGAGVEQEIDALAGGELALRVQLLDALASAAFGEARAPCPQVFETLPRRLEGVGFRFVGHARDIRGAVGPAQRAVATAPRPGEGSGAGSPRQPRGPSA